MKDKARNAYASAVEKLTTFCETRAKLDPYILDDEYPFKIKFYPVVEQQPSLFEDEDESFVDRDPNGFLLITVGLDTSVKSMLKFKMSSDVLKKLIKLTEKVGAVYYHAYREGADEENYGKSN